MPDLTTEILVSIRDEIRSMREQLSSGLDHVSSRVDHVTFRVERLEQVQVESERRLAAEIIAFRETFTDSMGLLRGSYGRRITDHERRILALESARRWPRRPKTPPKKA